MYHIYAFVYMIISYNILCRLKYVEIEENSVIATSPWCVLEYAQKEGDFKFGDYDYSVSIQLRLRYLCLDRTAS